MNFEDRRETYKKIWKKLSLSQKIFVVSLIVVGIGQVFLGIILCTIAK